MAIDQAAMTQTVAEAAIEAAKAAVQKVMAAREEENTGQRNKATSVRPKMGGLSVKQLTFWLELCRKIYRTEELKNGDKYNVTKL